MKNILKKYLILLIASYISIRIVAFLLLFIFPDLLTQHISKNETTSSSIDLLYFYLQYLANIVYIYFIFKDLKNRGLKYNLLLLTTLLTGYSGLIVSVIYISKYELNTSKKNEDFSQAT